MIGNLEEDFDAVVMLTWSDWHSEPRSNRYHFATRFAKRLPVFFVQLKVRVDQVEIEKIDQHNIFIVYINNAYGRAQSDILTSILSQQGVRKPLLWIYNSFFEDFIRFYPARLRVYHATEDYFSTTDSWTVAGVSLQDQLRRVLREIDLVVSVSSGVAESYRDGGGYHGPSILLRNGCDFEFWKETGAFEYAAPEEGRQVALFQGVINERIDFELLCNLAAAMPEWRFWFCGESVDPPGWSELAKAPNVKNFGFVEPLEIARLAKRSTVGLIPYKQGELIARSLPLKAYEYVACGLPVVTVPIVDLGLRPDLFAQARTAQEFRSAIEAAAATRIDRSLIKLRLAAGKAESYDRRFEDLQPALTDALRNRGAQQVCGNIVVLYGYELLRLRNQFEELQLLRKYSRHNVIFCDAESFEFPDGIKEPPDLSYIDAIIIHSSARAFSGDGQPSGLASVLRAHPSPKLLLAPAEGGLPAIARERIEGFGVDAVVIDAPERPFAANQFELLFPRVDVLATRRAHDRREDKSVVNFADRDHQDSVESGKYDSEALADCLDQYIGRRLNGRARARVVSFKIPALVAFGSHGLFEPLRTSATTTAWSADADPNASEDTDVSSTAFAIAHEALARSAQADRTLQEAAPAAAASPHAAPSLSLIAALSLRRAWRLLPQRSRSTAARVLKESAAGGDPMERSVLSRALVASWNLLPRKIRQILAERL
jgi:hypothetical protein